MPAPWSAGWRTEPLPGRTGPIHPTEPSDEAPPRLANPTRIAYTHLMEFLESRIFSKTRAKILPDDEFRKLQELLASNPYSGDVVQDTGGVRKVRWGDEERGKGKRGGSRVLYFYFLSDTLIYLMAIYGKDQKDDLSAEDKKIIKKEITEEKRARKG